MTSQSIFTINLLPFNSPLIISFLTLSWSSNELTWCNLEWVNSEFSVYNGKQYYYNKFKCVSD